jgi:hypothetical protein
MVRRIVPAAYSPTRDELVPAGRANPPRVVAVESGKLAKGDDSCVEARFAAAGTAITMA